jgi:4-hydroxythreonine-4-phosphate dehydrogenase
MPTQGRGHGTRAAAYNTGMKRLLITMGDVAGIGPEIITRAWPELLTIGTPVVVGEPGSLRRALDLVGSSAKVQQINHATQARPAATVVPCLAATEQDLGGIRPGVVSAAAGRAAYDFLCVAIDATLAGAADAVVTCPLHKEGLHAAGVPHPGHTEILAERTRAKRHAMLLYGDGVTVAHVTLHMALRDVFAHLRPESVRATIDLLDGILPKLLDGRRPRLGVCALNPHASDGGLFGDEEARIITPAVEAARGESINVIGPIPSDALWVRAAAGEFDGVVAMYHDQGHIAMKMRSGKRAVNITAGLPIVRTSVAHGTAYDIAGRGVADPQSLIEAARVAVKLASND